jgi:hypothetical protein
MAVVGDGKRSTGLVVERAVAWVRTTKRHLGG